VAIIAGMRTPAALLAAAGLAIGCRAAAGEPLADDPTIVALAVALACASPEDGAAGGADPGRARGGLELAATVRAETLRFDVLPCSGALAGIARRAAFQASRVNLPARPEEGIVYRNVELRLTVRADADVMTGLLAEARRASRGVRLLPSRTPGPALTSRPAARTP
jgi:hypothetical protein